MVRPPIFPPHALQVGLLRVEVAAAVGVAGAVLVAFLVLMAATV